MQIDWHKAIDDIFVDKISCRRCGGLNTVLVAGYSRASAASEFAPRPQSR